MQLAGLWPRPLQASLQNLAFLRRAKRPLEIRGRDAKRVRKKMPKKSRLLRKCAGRSWRKLSPIFRLLLHFSSFGVTSTLLVGLRLVIY